MRILKGYNNETKYHFERMKNSIEFFDDINIGFDQDLDSRSHKEKLQDLADFINDKAEFEPVAHHYYLNLA